MWRASSAGLAAKPSRSSRPAAPPASGSAACSTQERTPHAHIPVSGETRENFTAHERASGEQYRFVMPGERLKPAEWRAVLAAASARAPQILVASGSLPPGVPIALYGRLARAARQAGTRLVLDAAGAALAGGLDAGVWLAKPNIAELEEAVGGARLPDLPSRLAACRSLVRRGAAEIIALSMGSEGALLVSAQSAWRAAPPPLDALSTVGAGDSFVAGLVRALAGGLDHAAALRAAVAAGSAALLAPGTQLCRAADVQRLRQTTTVTAL